MADTVHGGRTDGQPDHRRPGLADTVHGGRTSGISNGILFSIRLRCDIRCTSGNTSGTLYSIRLRSNIGSTVRTSNRASLSKYSTENCTSARGRPRANTGRGITDHDQALVAGTARKGTARASATATAAVLTAVFTNSVYRGIIAPSTTARAMGSIPLSTGTADAWG